MEYFAILLCIVSIFLSIKAIKNTKQTVVQTECKNVLNQRVVNSVKEFDKKGKQIIFAAVKFDGDEIEHVLVNLQDFSEISATINPGT